MEDEMADIRWSYEKNANGQARLTGYSQSNGNGDRLWNDWTGTRDCVNQALTDELTGAYSQDDMDRLYALVAEATEGAGCFLTPADWPNGD